MSSPGHCLVVTCCVHPDNDPEGKLEEHPSAIFGLGWRSNGDMLMLAKEAQEVVSDGSDQWALETDDGQMIRHRIRERCAGCGATIVMREATTRALLRRLEGIAEIWRHPIENDPSYNEAVLSLSMVARLAEQLAART